MAAVLPEDLSIISANSWINLNLFKRKEFRRGILRRGKKPFPVPPDIPNFIRKRQI
jgi:hypothetical protein